MAEVVLVHGIDQQQKSADLLESEWLPALAGGVRTAGFSAVADRIWRKASGPRRIECRMAFFGGLFLAPGQQGDSKPPDFARTHAQGSVASHKAILGSSREQFPQTYQREPRRPRTR
jgi:hypothetical protein